jgi:hypothetical protein
MGPLHERDFPPGRQRVLKEHLLAELQAETQQAEQLGGDQSQVESEEDTFTDARD